MIAGAMSTQSRQAHEYLPAKVALLAMDFDGVLTDDRVIVAQDGTESVICSRSDGLGLGLLRDAGIDTVILSAEPNPVVIARGRKLGIPVHQGLSLDKKHEALQRFAAERDISLSDVVFIGNDVNDARCLELAGCGVVPVDAHPDVLPLADIVLTKRGGYGAVRELADLILKHRKQ